MIEDGDIEEQLKKASELRKGILRISKAIHEELERSRFAVGSGCKI